MQQIFKTKYIVNFRKYRSRKKGKIWLIKNGKIKKIEKTKELVAGSQEVECLWNMLSPSYKERKKQHMALINLSKKFDMSGKIFWK